MSDYRDCNGHGTCCIELIKRLAPNAEVFCIRVLDSHMRCPSNALIYALKCAMEMGAEIINLSLCTPTSSYELYSTCMRIATQGNLIIASHANRSSKVGYPATYPQVLGVRGGILSFENEYWLSATRREVVADISPTFVHSALDKIVLFSGYSKATALFTGITAKSIDLICPKDKWLNYMSACAKINIWNEGEIPMQLNQESASSISFQNRRRIREVVCRWIGFIQNGESIDKACARHFTPDNAFDLLKNINEEFFLDMDYYHIRGIDLLSYKALCSMLSKRLK